MSIDSDAHAAAHFAFLECGIAQRAAVGQKERISSTRGRSRRCWRLRSDKKMLTLETFDAHFALIGDAISIASFLLKIYGEI